MERRGAGDPSGACRQRTALGGIREEVSDLLNGATVVAHNASFDMGVLRSTLASHGCGHPTFQYFCSVSMAKKVWPGYPKYDLKSLCLRNGIPLVHHRAGNDAEATAQLVLRAMRARPFADVTSFLLDNGVKVGAFYADGHRTPGGKITPVLAVR
ncbi:MAG: hypothetical protein IPK99_00720 [Flavobacteriales bacterium]|nr:hypothetical protein [Flavobacteriales bacterium]